jgi:UDP-N-acetylmuramate--alanine ligase
VRESLVGFVGAKRRLEQKYYKNDTYLIDDYAHHPDEIAATIAALRARFEARRLLIIFQPHTFSRTEALRHDFAHSFQEADRVLLAPIFASARENSALFNITSLDLEKESRKAGIGHVKSFESKEELVAVLASILRPKDVVVTMGAGDIYKLDRDIIKAIDMLELER